MRWCTRKNVSRTKTCEPVLLQIAREMVGGNRPAQIEQEGKAVVHQQQLTGRRFPPPIGFGKHWVVREPSKAKCFVAKHNKQIYENAARGLKALIPQRPSSGRVSLGPE